MTDPYYRNTTDYQGLTQEISRISSNQKVHLVFTGLSYCRLRRARRVNDMPNGSTVDRVQFSNFLHRQVFSVDTAVLVIPPNTLYVFSFICNINHRSHPQCDHTNWVSISKLALWSFLWPLVTFCKVQISFESSFETPVPYCVLFWWVIPSFTTVSKNKGKLI